MDLIICMIFYAISYITYKINSRIINPLFIVPFLWATIILLYNLIPHILYPLQNQFLVGIFLWVVSFVLGGFLINYTLEKLPILTPRLFNRQVFSIYYLIIILFAPLSIYLLVVEALKADIQYLFLMLRSLNTGSEEMENPMGALGYIFNFAFAGLLLQVQNYNSTIKGERRRLNILIFLNVLLSIATVARTAFLFTGLSIFIVLYLNGKIKRKHYLVLLFSFVLIMLAMTLIRSISATDSSEETSLSNTISIYLFGGLPAFDTVSVDYYGQFGSNVLRFFYAVLNAFGGNFVVNKTIYDYVNVPVMTNVYTVMYPFYRDFGFYGISIFGFIYGFLFQGLYKFALNNYKLAQLTFAYIFPMLLMQFFGEYLFSNFSIFFQMLMIFSIPYFIKLKL